MGPIVQDELALHIDKLKCELQRSVFSGIRLRYTLANGTVHLSYGAVPAIHFPQELASLRLARLCLAFAAGDLYSFKSNSPGFSNDFRSTPLLGHALVSR